MSLLVPAAIAIFVVALLLFWPRQGKMGINLSSVKCPKCGRRMPMIRRPANQTQALWGGWTCKHCGCEMDKYGVEVSKNGEFADSVPVCDFCRDPIAAKGSLEDLGIAGPKDCYLLRCPKCGQFWGGYGYTPHYLCKLSQDEVSRDFPGAV